MPKCWRDSRYLSSINICSHKWEGGNVYLFTCCNCWMRTLNVLRHVKLTWGYSPCGLDTEADTFAFKTTGSRIKNMRRRFCNSKLNYIRYFILHIFRILVYLYDFSTYWFNNITHFLKWRTVLWHNFSFLFQIKVWRNRQINDFGFKKDQFFVQNWY